MNLRKNLILFFLLIFSTSFTQQVRSRTLELGLLPLGLYNSTAVAYTQKKGLIEHGLVAKAYFFSFKSSLESGFGIYASHYKYKDGIYRNKIYFPLAYGLKKTFIFKFSEPQNTDNYYNLFFGSGLGLKTQRYNKIRRIEVLVGVELITRIKDGEITLDKDKPLLPAVKLTYRMGIKINEKNKNASGLKVPKTDDKTRYFKEY